MVGFLSFKCPILVLTAAELVQAQNRLNVEVRLGFRLGLGSGASVGMVTGKGMKLGVIIHV